MNIFVLDKDPMKSANAVETLFHLMNVKQVKELQKK